VAATLTAVAIASPTAAPNWKQPRRDGRAIALLEQRTLRFSELQRPIDGISQRVLTVTLRQLERDGLVRRKVYPVVPPRVEYSLTPLGVTLHATIRSLVAWTEEHQSEIARAAYDDRTAAAQFPAASS
jgi:DNA-binding HxlR family transcriptional regulator